MHKFIREVIDLEKKAIPAATVPESPAVTAPQAKMSAMSRMTERFDIPAEALGATRLTVTGERRIMIERHGGILEYSHELISVNCGRRVLLIYGSRLDLVAMTSEELLITGEIARIEFE